MGRVAGVGWTLSGNVWGFARQTDEAEASQAEGLAWKRPHGAERLAGGGRIRGSLGMWPWLPGGMREGEGLPGRVRGWVWGEASCVLCFVKDCELDLQTWGLSDLGVW